MERSKCSYKLKIETKWRVLVATTTVALRDSEEVKQESLVSNEFIMVYK